MHSHDFVTKSFRLQEWGGGSVWKANLDNVRILELFQSPIPKRFWKQMNMAFCYHPVQNGNFLLSKHNKIYFCDSQSPINIPYMVIVTYYTADNKFKESSSCDT